MGIIALLTDFGLSDEYAGVMKGVILSINPSAQIVDLSHAIPPQDVRAASFMLESSVSYFPTGTVFVSVVDPGVGSDRRILAAKIDEKFFLAPDNGLLWPLIKDAADVEINSAENRDLFLPAISSTFHGRDIFAPRAAHISTGLDMAELGPPIAFDDIVKQDDSGPVIENHTIRGRVVWIDRFGNLATNILVTDLEMILAGRSSDILEIRAGKCTMRGLVNNYADAEQGEPAAMIGSRGLLEIAVPMGSARNLINAEPGLPVTVAAGGGGVK